MTTHPTDTTDSGDSTAISATPKGDHAVHIDRPAEPAEAMVDLDIEGVQPNENGDSIKIDYFFDRPILRVWEPGNLNLKHALALPTKHDPVFRNYIRGGEVVNDIVSRIINTHSSRPDFHDDDQRLPEYLPSVSIEKPSNREAPIELNIEGAVGNELGDSVEIDYFHGRPIIHIWIPGKEDAQHAFALPTAEDPHLREYIRHGEIYTRMAQIIGTVESQQQTENSHSESPA